MVAAPQGTERRIDAFEGRAVQTGATRARFDLAGGAIEAVARLGQFASGRIKLGSVGQVVPAVSLSIRNDDGQEVPVGSEGRLWIKTPATTVGYWDDPAATEAAFSNGWLDSGDVMRVDDDGYFFFRGRKKQIIVHDASNICPQEVEDALLAHPSVASAGVIGIHDLVHGENVRAHIIPH